MTFFDFLKFTIEKILNPNTCMDTSTNTKLYMPTVRAYQYIVPYVSNLPTLFSTHLITTVNDGITDIDNDDAAAAAAGAVVVADFCFCFGTVLHYFCFLFFFLFFFFLKCFWMWWLLLLEPSSMQ